MDAACTAGREARGGGGGLWAHYTGTCVEVGVHVYQRQVPHKDRFLIDLSGPGLEGSVWLPNCLKFGGTALVHLLGLSQSAVFDESQQVTGRGWRKRPGRIFLRTSVEFGATIGHRVSFI